VCTVAKRQGVAPAGVNAAKGVPGDPQVRREICRWIDRYIYIYIYRERERERERERWMDR